MKTLKELEQELILEEKLKQERSDFVKFCSNYLKESLYLKDINEIYENFEYLTTVAVLPSLIDILESYSDLEIESVLQSIPRGKDFLEYYPLEMGTETFYIDWDGETAWITNPDGEKRKLGDVVLSPEQLRTELRKFFKKYTAKEEEEEPDQIIAKELESETDNEKRMKLSILNTIIRPSIIYRFANTTTDRTRLLRAIISHIKNSKDEKEIKQELDQRAIVDIFFDLMDVILSNRMLANMVARNASTSIVSESKKERPKKRESVQDKIDEKLDLLLRLGLVSKSLYTRTKRALTGKKNVIGSIPVFRNLLLDLLGDVLDYIKKDSTIYNRMRIKVIKEMASYLEKPTKKRVLLTEVVPPNFPRPLMKKLLHRYRHDKRIAYATMWRIHKQLERKKEINSVGDKDS